jgi:hypothetical protein
MDDERRANALLALLGGPDKEQEKDLPDGFLREIMEIRQTMEEVLAAGNEARRRDLEEWAEGEREARLEKIAALFHRATHGDGESAAGPADPALLSEIRIDLNALRYIERMIEQLGPPEEL